MTTYGTDATGTLAHWYTGGMSLREATRTARGRLRYPGDTATVYRTPETPRASGPTECIAHYALRAYPEGIRIELRRCHPVDGYPWSAHRPARAYVIRTRGIVLVAP